MKTYTTTKGQIVNPAELRRKYKIKAGGKIHVIDTGDAILLKPVTEESLMWLQGRLKGKGVLKSMLEERRKEAEGGKHGSLQNTGQLCTGRFL